MLMKDLSHALSKLSKKELEIVRDIYFNEMTLSEIAKRRNCHASSVMKMRNKVLKKLRKIMEEKQEEFPLIFFLKKGKKVL